MPNFKTVSNRDEWDQALLTLPHAHALQTWDWGDFKSHWGWTAQRLLWVDHAGTPFAAAQILQRSIPYSPWNFLYASKGPLFDYTNEKLANQILADLEEYAQQTRTLFIKIDPDVPRQYGEPQADRALEPSGPAMLNRLTQRGWCFSPEQIQFRNTVIINLISEPEDLLAAMKSKWRYNIRLAGRKGVVIRQGQAGDIPAFYQMYAKTAARDGFLIRPAAYYREVWQRFMEAGRAKMLLASVGEDMVAGLILFVFGQTAWYMYGASTGQHRRSMPNHLLQWEAMCQAKAQGCTRYDMWGAPDVFDETDGMWGVYRFKRGFGGEVVQGLGAFDYPVNRPLYWAFTVALPRLRALRRRLKP
jgi:lipid II:glycine glycyltransferase (peptidoglycan interpeptide bridge formation enzyme)